MGAIVGRIAKVRPVSIHLGWSTITICDQEINAPEKLFKVDDLAIVISPNTHIPQWLISKYDLYYYIRNYGGHLVPQINISRDPIIIPLIPCQIFTPRWRFVDEQGKEHVVEEWEDVSKIVGIE